MINFIELYNSATQNESTGFVSGRNGVYNIGYIWTILIIIIVIVTLLLHKTLKQLWRRILKDRLLEDQQVITEYERFKMEEEIKRLQEENEKLKKEQ